MTIAQGYEPVTKFDLNRFVNVRWYQQAFWVDADFGVQDCQIWRFTSACKSQNILYFQLGFNSEGPSGPLGTGTNLIKLTDVQGKFFYMSDYTNVLHYYYVLDYDSVNYNWVIWADTFNPGGYISALSKKPNDPVAQARGAQLAAKYGVSPIHEVVHNANCNYKETEEDFLFHRQ